MYVSYVLVLCWRSLYGHEFAQASPFAGDVCSSLEGASVTDVRGYAYAAWSSMQVPQWPGPDLPFCLLVLCLLAGRMKEDSIRFPHWFLLLLSPLVIGSIFLQAAELRRPCASAGCAPMMAPCGPPPVTKCKPARCRRALLTATAPWDTENGIVFVGELVMLFRRKPLFPPKISHLSAPAFQYP